MLSFVTDLKIALQHTTHLICVVHLHFIVCIDQFCFSRLQEYPVVYELGYIPPQILHELVK